MDDLNTSDHLPLVVDMMYALHYDDKSEGASCRAIRIDWEKAKKLGAVDRYQHRVRSFLAPLLNNNYDTPEDMEKEINYVVTLLRDAPSC